jgi:hypothetical protein
MILSGCPKDEETVAKDAGCEEDSHPRLGTVTPGWENVARVCTDEDYTSIRLENLSPSVLSVVGQEGTDLLDAESAPETDPVKEAKQIAVASSLGTFSLAHGAKLVAPEASIVGTVNPSAPQGTVAAVSFGLHTGETFVLYAATMLVDWIAEQLPDRPGDFADTLADCAKSAGRTVLEWSNVPNEALLARAVQVTKNCTSLFSEVKKALGSAEDEAALASKAATVVRTRTAPLWDDVARLVGKVGRLA